jgi:hypothetical protein
MTLIGVMGGVCWPIILSTEFTVFLDLLQLPTPLSGLLHLLLLLGLLSLGLGGECYSARDSLIVVP